MSEIIKISSEVIGTEAVNSVRARELHLVLEIKKDFTSWISTQIKSLGLEEDVDYIVSEEKVKAGNGFTTRKEYIISTDTAKHISMASRTAKGREVRAYFIEIEKRFSNDIGIEVVPKSKVDEMLKASNRLFEEFEKQKLELEELKKQLKQKDSSTPLERRIRELFGDIDPVKYHVISSYIKSFENCAGWKPLKFENEFALFRKDWMVLLNIAMQYLEEARNPKKVQVQRLLVG